MSVERIRELLALMNENDLVELRLREGDFKVTLRKPGANVVTVPAPMPAPMPALAPVAAAAPAKAAATDDEGLVPVKSPIVGTFYRSPGPDMPAFVAEGTVVTKDTVVCIVEAMKIMNEIRAEVAGTVVRAVAESGEPVEYGQTLFLIRP